PAHFDVVGRNAEQLGHIPPYLVRHLRPRPESRAITPHVGDGTGRANRSVHLKGCLISCLQCAAGILKRLRCRSLTGDRIILGYALAHRLPERVRPGQTVPIRPLRLAGFRPRGVEIGSELCRRLNRRPFGLGDHPEKIPAHHQLHEPRNVLEPTVIHPLQAGPYAIGTYDPTMHHALDSHVLYVRELGRDFVGNVLTWQRTTHDAERCRVLEPRLRCDLQVETFAAGADLDVDALPVHQLSVGDPAMGRASDGDRALRGDELADRNAEVP